MNKTQNYQLNQWAKSDRVLMDDFNADNAKIDAAIHAVDQRVTSVSLDKASRSALNALSATVSGHTSALAQKGNCQIVTGTYTGSAIYSDGTTYSHSLTFPFQPKLVVVQNQEAAQMDVGKGSDNYKFMLILVRPLQNFYLYQSMAQVKVSWSGNSVSWSTDHSSKACLNDSGRQYTYVALG